MEEGGGEVKKGRPLLKYKGKFISKKALDHKLKMKTAVAEGWKRRHERAQAESLEVKAEPEAEVNTPSYPEFHPILGSRIVDMEVLVQGLKCCKCQQTLSLENVTHERRIGLHSVFNVWCMKCDVNTEVHTGTVQFMGTRSQVPDINRDIAQGSVKANICHKSLSQFLDSLDIPNISSTIFKRYKLELLEPVEDASKDENSEALDENEEASVEDNSPRRDENEVPSVEDDSQAPNEPEDVSMKDNSPASDRREDHSIEDNNSVPDETDDVSKEGNNQIVNDEASSKEDNQALNEDDNPSMEDNSQVSNESDDPSKEENNKIDDVDGDVVVVLVVDENRDALTDDDSQVPQDVVTAPKESSNPENPDANENQ